MSENLSSYRRMQWLHIAEWPYAGWVSVLLCSTTVCVFKATLSSHRGQSQEYQGIESFPHLRNNPYQFLVHPSKQSPCRSSICVYFYISCLKCHFLKKGNVLIFLVQTTSSHVCGAAAS